MPRSIVRSVLAAVSLAGMATAHASTLTWPGVAPCNGTLQACIDGSGDGDRIEIATTTPIAEDISLYEVNRTLTSVAGLRATFAPGHTLTISSSSTGGDVTASVSRLTFPDGSVSVVYFGTGTATYDLRDLVIGTAGATGAQHLSVTAYGGTVNAMLYNNRVTGVPQSLNSGLIELRSQGGILNADAYYNTVKSTNTTDYTTGGGIFADYAFGGSGGTLNLHGNEVRGSFGRAALFVSEGLFSSTPIEVTAHVYNNVIVGVPGASGTAISFTPSSGTIHAQAVANTITSSRVGISVLQWNDGADTARVDGTISSNLIRATTGIYATAAISPSLTNDYNLVNAESNGVTFGAHTITADAKIVSESTPRLRSDSPAIGAADSATVLLGILFNGLPDLDADGLRRLKGSPNAVDIGAYEFGDLTFSHTVTAANTGSGSHITRFDDASTDGVPDAKVIVTSNFNNGTSTEVLYSPPFGVYYNAGKWKLFAQDIAPAPLGAHFDVFVPAIGGGSFTQVATGDNTSGSVSRIDNSSTDSLPDRIVLVTQNWTVGDHGIYNPHQAGLLYFGKWFVANLDGASMPVNAGFNIYAQAASPNAFRVVASTNGNALVLDHPLLDGIPCARPHVSRILGASGTDYGFDVDYFAGHWEIYAHAPLSIGDQFNVVIDPAQVAACDDRIFANGFDG